MWNTGKHSTLFDLFLFFFNSKIRSSMKLMFKYVNYARKDVLDFASFHDCPVSPYCTWVEEIQRKQNPGGRFYGKIPPRLNKPSIC